MNNFNKKNIIIYTFLIIYLIIGKFFLESNYPNIYFNIYNPIVLLIISLLTYFFNRDNIDRFKKKKDLLETIVIIMMFYMIIYFVSGLFFDYAYSPYSHSFIGIIKNLWTFVIIIIFKEYIRYNLIKDSNNNKIIYFLVMLIFIAIELNFLSISNNFETNEAIFKYVTSIIIPIICHNVVANYLVLHGSYKVSIVYLLSLELLNILLPIYPNLDWFFSSLYEIILAIIIYAFTSDFYENKVLRIRKKRKSKGYVLSYIPYLILIIFVILFMSGFFKYKPIAIISNSMYPNIKRGDAVISEKINEKDLKSIKLNDIIEYRLGGASVVHRVIGIDLDKDGNLVFVTKGDNNTNIDDEKVTEGQVLGIVHMKVPFVGYPTVWLAEFFNENEKPNVELGN